MSLREQIVVEARSWLKTPYHHHARVKGVGVDCAQILIAVFAAVGVIDEFDPGNYARDWHMHRNEEVYAQWLDRFGRRVETPAVGDVALFRFGRTFSHGAIVVDEQPSFIHSYIETGVTLTRIDEAPLAGRPVLYWSIA